MENRKTALVTQTYRMDHDECVLLCESIDRFAPGLDHFIFVNDEDIAMFRHLEGGRRHVLPKSVVLPRHLIRVPFKILGHHFHVSPFTMPVREWIVQQICKLGVFDIIGDSYDAVYHYDSEVVMMKPWPDGGWVRDGSYPMYKVVNVDEPSHDDYIRAAVGRLGISAADTDEAARYCYMNVPVCFRRDNTRSLLDHIGRRHWSGSWKLALCNTYRFSEYYTYGIYTSLFLGGRGHYRVDTHPYPVVDISLIDSPETFRSHAAKLLSDPAVHGLWFQKRDRKNLASSYLPFNDIRRIVTSMWD